MSVFRCGDCEELFDADYEGCFENPLDGCSSLCEECSIEAEEKEKFVNHMEDQMEYNDDYNGPGDEYYENLMSQEHSA